MGMDNDSYSVTTVSIIGFISEELCDGPYPEDSEEICGVGSYLEDYLEESLSEGVPGRS